MVKAAEPYSAARRWLASGQYTVVGHEVYAVGQNFTIVVAHSQRFCHKFHHSTMLTLN